MKARAKSRLLLALASVALLLMASALPVYSVARTGNSDPGNSIVAAAATRGCPSANRTNTECGAEIGGRIIEALTSFYTTLITIVLVLLTVVLGLSIWSVRVMSRGAAEDIARDVVVKLIKDSVEFKERIEALIDDAMANEMAERLDALTAKVEAHDKALREFLTSGESIQETEVVPTPPTEE